MTDRPTLPDAIAAHYWLAEEARGLTRVMPWDWDQGAWTDEEAARMRAQLLMLAPKLRASWAAVEAALAKLGAS